jgi:translocation and assembly module TamA
MKSKTLCFALIGWLLHAQSQALDLPKLPFLKNDTDFSIELNGETTLLKRLEEELGQQRKTNLQLRQYSKRSKIVRFETNLLNEYLRSEGYYAGEIGTSLNKDKIIYRINSGPLYRIEKLTLKLPTTITGLSADSLGIKEGDPLRAETVLRAKKNLIGAIAKQFCLYRINVEYRVVVFHKTQSATVVLSLDESQLVSFGDITFTGLRSLDESYLRQRLPIKQGDCFNRGRIDAAHITLMQTNLLVRADFQIGDPIDGRVPISLNVIERFHRTVSAGAGFQSDEGFGLSTGWEHRNVRGSAQELSTDAYVAQNLQTVTSNLTLPHFRRSDQYITFYSQLERRATDAFESKLVTAGVEITRPIKRHLDGILGVELEFSEVKEDDLVDSFALLSLPFSLRYDKRNDPLDPRHGWVASAQFRPYWDAYDTNTRFLQSTLAASAYRTFEDLTWQPTFAVRGALGTLSGIERDEVPANIRYYTGGGGSVRGYPFQTLGPLTDNEPDGGLSFTEVSMETRLRWGENWGGVVFLDGGFAYADAVPKFGQDLHWGAGFGLRYYTSFAPIRLDVAVPLNKRDAIDDSLQVYISIGQAF